MATAKEVSSLSSSTSPKTILLHLYLLGLTLTCTRSARLHWSPAVAGHGRESPVLSFFMHDILGGSAPSERVVAGLTPNTQINTLPFSKPNSGVFPLTGGIPLVNANSRTVIGNNGKNNNVFVNGKGIPFVTAGQLPPGSTLQNLLFGTITVIDDEITQRQEIGAPVMGRAQGFHLASLLDRSSQTMAFTVMLGGEGEDHQDTISFFGVHRTDRQRSSSLRSWVGQGSTRMRGVIPRLRLSICPISIRLME